MAIRDIYQGRLFLGHAGDVRDLPQLHRQQIAAIVDLVMNKPPASVGREMVYLRVPLLDGEGNSDAALATAIRVVAMLLKVESKTLVACSAGLSRSPSIAAAAIAWVTNRPLDVCLVEVLGTGPRDVSPALWSHVKTVFKSLDG